MLQIKEHPDKRWVQKEKKHKGKGVKFVNITTVDFRKSSLLQEFIHPPYLIDDRYETR